MSEPAAATRSTRSSWSRRLLALVEDLGMTAALRDGRRLDRTGAVLDLRRTGNLVVARVRHLDGDVPATRADPEIHKARLAVRTFTGGQWARIERALASRASYAASLLVGTVPPDVDRLFTALGLSPLPTGADDLAMDCTCTDWQRPCAHLAAACHALARHLDHDPFELLALRGRERDVLLDSLRTYRGVPVPVPVSVAGLAAVPVPVRAAGSDPARVADGGPVPGGGRDATALPRDVATFWADSASAPPHPRSDRVTDTLPASSQVDHTSVLDRCGPLRTSGPDTAGSDTAGSDRTGPDGAALADGVGADLRPLLRPAYLAFDRRRRIPGDAEA
ncbi:hypothetical protein MXD61_05065 [Frankia sp. AgPm24]|uniref:SWIM zinc finger family protein n=1 Tax=Frankia sp. AgPm24 TaxID=631128 RepID=UPI0020103447|nr:hypothetical protein [Frankia sp. AgPm24]MCK9921276.1 hypothetical protein [Frankia sp. AgPm24]